VTKPVASLPDRLGVPFRDLALLRGALMHHSYRYERPADAATHPDTQRLEFLGDAVVNMIATRMVFHAFPSADEGTMTRLRSALIRTENLAAIARVYALGEYVILSKGEEHAGGRNRVSLLADVCESVLAAMYLEHGLTVVHEFLAPHFVPHLEQLRASGTPSDPRSYLQEEAQRRYNITPRYRTVSSSGPEHLRTFVVEATIGAHCVGSGSGSSQPAARTAAAAAALAYLAEHPSFDPTQPVDTTPASS
jgi:ribonuclease-3